MSVDIVGLLNDLTGGNLLAWKVTLTTVVFALAGLQVAMAASLWRVGGIPGVTAATAAGVHRWSGRLTLALSLAVAFACLVGPAGPSSPTRVLLHSLFGALLFAVLAAKFALLKLTPSGNRFLPAAGSLLFLTFGAIWATSVADYVRAR
ncbi:MAG: DUF6529 family protein [Acidimicrobiales bacterium]